MRHDEILGLLHYLLAPGEEPTLTWAGRWELAFWAMVLLITALLLLFRPSWLVRAEDSFRRISQHRTACIWAVGGAVIALRTMLLPLIPVPVPVILDEFSYLLGADTFASGRLTNPPHPMWIHFETFNVNMQPTYQSMYPPAQGLVLALGQKLTGVPWVGVLLSVAVMCGAFCWMLQGWMPPQWALLGGIYAVVRYGIFSYWINSYWGGAVAATGGALLLGALPRLRRKITWQHSIVFVVGLVILANSRPFEGLLFALPLCLAVMWLLFRVGRVGRSGLPRRQLLARVVVPCLLLLGLACAWMLYYNWRGTGNALQMPYTLNQAAYHVSKPFLFQQPSPIPHYHNPQMRTFYMFHEYPDLLLSRTQWGIQTADGTEVFLLLRVHGVACSPPVRSRSAAGRAQPGAAGSFPGCDPHATGTHDATVAGPRTLCGSCLGGGPPDPVTYSSPASHGPQFSLAPLVHAGYCVEPVPLDAGADQRPALESLRAGELPPSDRADLPKEIDRERLLAQLSRLPGQHLILVHYSMRDVPSKEWIYNRADIDGAKIVWARDMGPQANQELLRYFANRRIWYVDRSSGSVLMPYASALELEHPANGVLSGN